MRRLAAFFLIALFCAPSVQAAEPIKIGLLSSITGLANEAYPLDNGVTLAAEEINAKGGVLGRPLEIILRDDKNSPTEATKEATRLDQDDHVPVLIGTLLDNVGQAVLNYAGRAKLPFVKPTGATDAFVWKDGNAYSFRNDTSTDTLGTMLAKEAAKNPAKRWVVLAPNYEFGHAMYAAFKRHLAALRPDVVWVGEHFPNYNKMNAGAVVQLVEREKPDAVFNALISQDMVNYVREIGRRKTLQQTYYVAPYLGWPEYAGIFKSEYPIGWLTNGFPTTAFKDPKLKAFVDAYAARFHEQPGASSLMGYTTLYLVADALTKAGGTDREKIREALKTASTDAPFGKLAMRAIDHQTNFGAWIGKTALDGDKPTLSDWRYQDAAPYFPNDAVTRTLRPAGAE